MFSLKLFYSKAIQFTILVSFASFNLTIAPIQATKACHMYLPIYSASLSSAFSVPQMGGMCLSCLIYYIFFSVLLAQILALYYEEL